jgi:hypothetical protein
MAKKKLSFFMAKLTKSIKNILFREVYDAYQTY